MSGNGALDFRLLGRVEVTRDGEPVAFRGGRPRELLVILLLNRNRTVTFEQLTRDLWGGSPPTSVTNAIHGFVHRLRGALGLRRGDRVLLTRPGGYELRTASEQVDVDRFARLVEQARTHRARRELASAWDRFDEALRLWRGAALADVADRPFAQTAAARLEERRLAAVEEQLHVGLELGRHSELVGELEGQIRLHPDRAELHRLLMLALYRSGRQAEALAAYQTARAALGDRHGGRPGEDLDALQRAILVQDPSLRPPGQAAALVAERPERGTPQPRAGSRDGRGVPPWGVDPGREPARGRHLARSIPGVAGASRPATGGTGIRSQPRAGRGLEGEVRRPARAVPPGSPEPRAAEPPGDPPAQDERKLVTALVVGVTAEGADPEDVRAWGTEVMTCVIGRIHHFGGIVQTATVDRLLAVFGAEQSREDDPERAVRAALDIVAGADDQAQTSRRPAVAVRAGVATGDAVITSASADEPPPPMAITPADAGGARVVALGDIVHLAAALEQAAAAGTVLVGSATHQATSRSISYRPVQPSSPLEQASGLRLWQALAPRARTGAHVGGQAATPLVERERELGIMADILGRLLRDREPQMVTLVSEPGLGKSRLVDELSRQADQAPELVGWRVGRTYPYDQGAMGALVEVVKAQAGILDDDDAQAMRRKLQQAAAPLLGDEAEQVTESLRTLVGAAGARPLDSQRNRLLDDAARFLAAVAAQRPLVVVFEDLQWADETLLEFVDGLLERVGLAPLVVVATGRPEFLDHRPGWGGGQRNAVTISLSPLTREGVGKLLGALQGPDPLPDGVRAALLTASGGNPLYVEEYVRMLREQDREPAPTGEALPMPTSVQQVIAARIDTLPPADKRLLQDAAVIGETGWAGALAAVSGLDAAEVRAGLERLQRRALLRRVRAASVAGETEYAFRHTLIREVAYGQVLRGERADKHQRMAGWIESLSPDPGDRAELLAHHYGRALELARAAGQPTGTLAERARQVSRMAGERAARLGSFSAAARAYQAALGVWPEDDPDRAELLLGLGQALVFSAHTGEDILDQARQAALAHGREAVAVEADALVGLLARTRRDWAARERTQQRLARTAGQYAAESRLAALGNHALELIMTDRHAEAATVARELIALARAHGRPDHEGSGMHLEGQARILAGDPDGLAEIRQGTAMMDEHQFPRRFIARYACARALWWYGDLEGCAAVLAEGRRLAGQTDTAIEPWFDGIQVAVDYANGRWDTAVATAHRALAQGPPGARVPAECLIYRGGVALARGQVDEALADARAALQAISPDDTRYRQVATALEGRCLLAAGHRAQAVARLEHLLADQRTRPAESCATTDEAALLLDLGYPPGAVPDGLPPTRWHQAVRALAARDLHQAVELFTMIGSQVDVAATRARLDGT